MYERRRLHELSTGNLSVLRLSYNFDQASLAPLNDIVHSLFLLTTLPTFSGHDAQHDVFLKTLVF